jgi:hypothetical protein
MTEKETWTITCTGREIIKTGSNANGNWTLYKVEADDSEGHLITEDMTSFQQFPIGRQIEVEVERHESERWGVTYRLRGPESDPMADLEARIAELEQRVGLCEKALSGTAQSQVANA